MVNKMSFQWFTHMKKRALKGGFFVAGVILPLMAFYALQAERELNAQEMIIERVWSDFHTGYALSGFDVVAYFTEGEPRQGRLEHEVLWQDYYFYFINQGNKEAFLANPEVYLPAYGGFSPVQLSEGRLVEGNPEIWAIEQNRLVLFSNHADRLRWDLHKGTIAEDANRQWLSRTRH